jgi:hypothetical protein
MVECGPVDPNTLDLGNSARERGCTHTSSSDTQGGGVLIRISKNPHSQLSKKLGKDCMNQCTSRHRCWQCHSGVLVEYQPSRVCKQLHREAVARSEVNLTSLTKAQLLDRRALSSFACFKVGT